MQSLAKILRSAILVFLCPVSTTRACGDSTNLYVYLQGLSHTEWRSNNQPLRAALEALPRNINPERVRDEQRWVFYHARSDQWVGVSPDFGHFKLVHKPMKSFSIKNIEGRQVIGDQILFLTFTPSGEIAVMYNSVKKRSKERYILIYTFDPLESTNSKFKVQHEIRNIPSTASWFFAIPDNDTLYLIDSHQPHLGIPISLEFPGSSRSISRKIDLLTLPPDLIRKVPTHEMHPNHDTSHILIGSPEVGAPVGHLILRPEGGLTLYREIYTGPAAETKIPALSAFWLENLGSRPELILDADHMMPTSEPYHGLSLVGELDDPRHLDLSLPLNPGVIKRRIYAPETNAVYYWLKDGRFFPIFLP